MSGGFVGFLQAHDIALAFTSYQSGRLYLLSRNPKGGLMVNEQNFHKAMGLHVAGNALYLATLGSIIRLENILKPGQWINETFTQCYVPRTIHFTGILDTHDVAVTARGEIIFVNTLYNCVATISKSHSFKPVWWPPFISALVAEDRCHLNGLALDSGEVRYVTAVSRSDTIDGWRDRRADGGIIMDVSANEVVCEGLSMPHSPRVHQGELYVLNSGTGELGRVDRKAKSFQPIVFCPGFVRGLSFHGRNAVVGLSRPRYERFEGLQLDKKLADADSTPWTGVQIIDLETGQCIHWFRIDGPVAELYDTSVLPSVGCAKSIAFPGNEPLNLITAEA
jgi:uncharacterized protein (TIGR03032 family)